MSVAGDDKTIQINSVDRLQIVSNECRICFEKCNEVWEIFHPTNEEIPRKLMELAAVQIEQGDGLPAMICYNCRRLLDISYEFKCQVQQSDAKFREMLMLKDSAVEDEKILSLSHSVNAAITEAIADEMAHNSGENNSPSHHIVEQLNEHHYVSHHEPIIFRIEPPSEHHNPCVLEQSLTNMDNEICSAEKRITMNECDDNQVVNVLIEKYDELVETDITTQAYKTESMMISDSDYSDGDNNDGIVGNLGENENIEAQVIKDESTQEPLIEEGHRTEETLKENYESDNEEKPLIARTQRLKCPNCIKTFATKTSLDRHIEIHKKKTNSRYVCYMCDEQFADITKLKSHVVANHDGTPNEEKINYTSEDGTRMEKQSSKSDSKKSMKFSCNICGKQFTYQKPFLAHAKTHPGYEPEKIVEKDENIAGSDESNERGNESDDEDMPLEGLQCPQCGKLFATKRNLKRHISTHSGLKFNCSSCSKEFSRIDKLKEHEQSKHKEDFFASSDSDSDDDTDNENKNNYPNESRKKEKHSRPHQCPMCPKAFAQEQSLTNHMERHKRVKDTQKRFLCEVCSKCFAQSGSLVAHMRTHTGVKPYVCNVCSRAFTKSTYLQLHLRTHSGEKPYICQYCSRAFARANTLARHITMHTGEAKYHCQICMKSFRRLTSLNEHTYTHTGQRPYACKICTKRYNNAGSLYAHTKKCKAQQTSVTTTTYALPADDEIHQNGAAMPPMMIYSQKKLTEETSIDQLSPTPQFLITNVHNPSLKTLPTNIIPQFTIEDPNFCTLNTKSFKNPYYTIYPNI